MCDWNLRLVLVLVILRKVIFNEHFGLFQFKAKLRCCFVVIINVMYVFQVTLSYSIYFLN